ncbi:MAG: hypothetical protein KC900_02695 [Candidatus Omnitrophica bacterium]|nr:hypothetical protein [Candidatus Omnitrophota bacterium]
MLYTITLLTTLYFAFTYPLCFWISRHDPLKNNFHHFHLGLPVIVGILALFFVVRAETPSWVNIGAVLWMIAALVLTAYAWRRESAPIGATTFLCVCGLGLTYQVQSGLVAGGLPGMLTMTLSGLIFSASLYAMNLGHWYLNVHGLPIKHLRHAANAFWILITARLLWNLVHAVTGQILYQGQNIRLYEFMGRLDGFLLMVPIFFGVLLPFGAMFMVHEIIKLKNTQAATGILYVILCGVLVGDIAYKYFLIKFGITL